MPMQGNEQSKFVPLAIVIAAGVLVGFFIFYFISVEGVRLVVDKLWPTSTSSLSGITDTPYLTVTTIVLIDTYTPTFTNSPTSTSTPTATFTATATTTFTATVTPAPSPTPTPTLGKPPFNLGIASFYLPDSDEDCRPGEQIFTTVAFENNKLKVIGVTASLDALRKVQSFKLSYSSMATNANWYELAQGTPTKSESVLYEGPLPLDKDGLLAELRQAKLWLVVTYSSMPATDRGCFVIYTIP